MVRIKLIFFNRKMRRISQYIGDPPVINCSVYYGTGSNASVLVPLVLSGRISVYNIKESRMLCRKVLDSSRVSLPVCTNPLKGNLINVGVSVVYLSTLRKITLSLGGLEGGVCR